jgi:LuxR family maltose regulon positive regulatory protein
VHQAPAVAAARVRTLLRQGELAAAVDLAEAHDLPTSQARVHLARGDTRAALAVLEPLRRQAETRNLPDQRLKVMVLQALALHMDGQEDQAVHLLGAALVLAEPGGFIRTFVDEGPPMARLLYETVTRGTASNYARQLLEAFPIAEPKPSAPSALHGPSSALVEPLSERELEVLALLAQGLTNREIASRLFLALNTVKAHTRNIYGKLDVHSRTQAVATARGLGLLPST